MRKAIALGLLAGGFALGAPVNVSAQDSGETVVLAFFFRVRTPG